MCVFDAGALLQVCNPPPAPSVPAHDPVRSPINKKSRRGPLGGEVLEDPQVGVAAGGAGVEDVRQEGEEAQLARLGLVVVRRCSLLMSVFF